MIPDDHEEVDLQDYDPEDERNRRSRFEDDDDDERGNGHPGVSCATQ